MRGNESLFDFFNIHSRRKFSCFAYFCCELPQYQNGHEPIKLWGKNQNQSIKIRHFVKHLLSGKS